MVSVLAGAAASPPCLKAASSAPTATVAPDCTRISPRTPLAGAGTSTVTLSVSSSTSGSSALTVSPDFLNHLPTVASVTLSPSVGTRISIDILSPRFFVCAWRLSFVEPAARRGGCFVCAWRLSFVEPAARRGVLCLRLATAPSSSEPPGAGCFVCVWRSLLRRASCQARGAYLLRSATPLRRAGRRSCARQIPSASATSAVCSLMCCESNPVAVAAEAARPA